MGGFGWPSSSYSDTCRVIEQAKEELQMLEAQHPDRFHYLKIELNSFITDESQKLLLIQNENSNILSTATTQVSSSSRKRKRKKVDYGEKTSKQQKLVQSNNRVEAVLERAQACFLKIKDLKTSFFGPQEGSRLFPVNNSD